MLLKIRRNKKIKPYISLKIRECVIKLVIKNQNICPTLILNFLVKILCLCRILLPLAANFNTLLPLAAYFNIALSWDPTTLLHILQDLTYPLSAAYSAAWRNINTNKLLHKTKS